MARPPLFVIVGSPAVGKSSAARAVAASFDRSLHIPVDDLRDMVVSGQVLPDPVWTDEITVQLGLARRAALEMAALYREAGFAVALDDFVDPNLMAEYAGLLQEDGVVAVVLRPEQETARARNRGRSGDDPVADYLDGGIAFIYDQLARDGPALEEAGWVMVDNTHLSIEQTAERIVALLGG